MIKPPKDLEWNCSLKDPFLIIGPTSKKQISAFTAEFLLDDHWVVLEVETRAELVIALKNVSPGSVRWIKHNSIALEDEKWMILAEARELRLNLAGA